MSLNPLESGQSFELWVVSLRGNLNVCGLNPLESGQSFEFNGRRVVQCDGHVSIPSNRGNHSNKQKGRGQWNRLCLNPLESGQSFELSQFCVEVWYQYYVSIPSNRGNHSNTRTCPYCHGSGNVSQSPRIGAIIRMQNHGLHAGAIHAVSIPSNRGNHSNGSRKKWNRLMKWSVSIPSNRGNHSNIVWKKSL